MLAPYHTEEGVTLYQGDALDVLPTLAPEAADMIVTSPPYFKLRDYGHASQIGQEDSFADYIEAIVAAFRLVRPILKPEGVVFLNIGDRWEDGVLRPASDVAYALYLDGWVRAQQFVWWKSNQMPFGSKCRPTNDWESVYMLTKQTKGYTYNKTAVMVPAEWKRWGKQTVNKEYRGIKPIDMDSLEERRAKGKAVRAVWADVPPVWEIPTTNYRGQHDAVAPYDMVHRCISLGSPEGGVVLNPFCGAGTSVLAARDLGREFVGIELVQDSLDQAISRLAAAGTPEPEPEPLTTLGQIPEGFSFEKWRAEFVASQTG